MMAWHRTFTGDDDVALHIHWGLGDDDVASYIQSGTTMNRTFTGRMVTWHGRKGGA